LVRRKKENRSSAVSTIETKKQKLPKDQELFAAKILKHLKQNEQQLRKVILLVSPLQKYFRSRQKQLQAFKLIQSDVKQLQSQIFQIQREIRKLAIEKGKIGLRHKATKQNKKR
jgi:hypothetical protein